MKTMTLSLAALLAALLTLVVCVAPAEAVYKGSCGYWALAALHAHDRGDKKGYQLAIDHYHRCEKEAMAKAESEALARDLILGIGIVGSQHGSHSHSHNNH